MSEATQPLIASALRLSPQERAVVANAILASLEGPTDNGPPKSVMHGRPRLAGESKI